MRIGRGPRASPSDRSAVIGPVQNRLSLLSAALDVARLAMFADGRDVPRDPLPPADLPAVVARAPAHVVPAVPLKPATRILRMNPAVAAPLGERLRRVHAEAVEARVVTVGTQLRASEPARRKFVTTISHVFTPEDAEREHLLRRELRVEAGLEVASGRLRPPVHVALLHPIVDDDLLCHEGPARCCGVSTSRSTSNPFVRAASVAAATASAARCGVRARIHR